jgi:hypothetical protein
MSYDIYIEEILEFFYFSNPMPLKFSIKALFPGIQHSDIMEISTILFLNDLVKGAFGYDGCFVITEHGKRIVEHGGWIKYSGSIKNGPNVQSNVI